MTLFPFSCHAEIPERLPTTERVYAIYGDFVEINCPVNLKQGTPWEYNWTTPRRSVVDGCPSQHVFFATYNDSGWFTCTVRDRKLRQYVYDGSKYDVTSSIELVILSGKVSLKVSLKQENGKIQLLKVGIHS